MKMLEMEKVEKHKGCRASLALLNVREDKLLGNNWLQDVGDGNGRKTQGL